MMDKEEDDDPWCFGGEEEEAEPGCLSMGELTLPGELVAVGAHATAHGELELHLPDMALAP